MQTAIYGQNGAGKSNLVKALEFMRAFALDKNRRTNKRKIKAKSSVINDKLG